MKFGAMVMPQASDWRLFAELEQMGYDSAWVPDSQMIYSDTYAVLALAAANTSRIRLGPGVADAQETAALRDFDPAYVSSGSIADRRAQADVRSASESGRPSHAPACLQRANLRLMRCSRRFDQAANLTAARWRARR